MVETRSGLEEEVVVPDKCPSCGEETRYEGEHLYCFNPNCDPQLKGRLVHFASRDAMNIDGLAEKTVELFFDNSIIHSFLDIYKLKEKESEIIKFEGFGKKKFDKIMEGVEASKEREFEHFLYALCIRNIGRTASRILAKEFGNIDNILSGMKDFETMKARLLAIPDFGETMASCFMDFFKDESNVKMIEEFRTLGINMTAKRSSEAIKIDSAINGKSFAITGKLEIVKNRAELEGMIQARGGKVANGVNASTNYLVNNDSTSNSSKNQKAKQFNIPIITEMDILGMMQ